MTFALLFSALWALLLLCAFLGLVYVSRFRITSVLQCILIIVFVASLARLVPEIILPVGAEYDIESYQTVGTLVLDRQNVYTSDAATGRHPYLPLQMYWMGFSKMLATRTHLPFVKIVKLAPIVADVAIAVILFMLLKRRTGILQTAFWGGLMYSVNPISVFVSSYHGQFDAIPLLCILLALWSLPKSSTAAGAWLGLGILDKSWPVLVLPSILFALKGWSRRSWLLITATLVPLIGIVAYSLFFDAPWETTIRTALGYNRGIGIWGYTYFARLLSLLRPDFAGVFGWLVNNARYLTLGALGLVWVLRASRQYLEAGILTLLVSYFALTHAFAIQYLVWIIPFAILCLDEVWLIRFTLAAFSYMFLSYNTLILDMHIDSILPWPTADYFIIMPAALPVWFVTLGWMFARFRVRGRTRNSGTSPYAVENVG
jgi:hypothetical protein